ncbi:cystathionine beta-synthase-like isoform X2 [Belonocnema kinseyi]|nr:cystathionine beta-synthase-like isoform X2 [Belonocnema kinseyi]
MDQKKVLPNILEAIGQTPMVRLNKISKLHGIKCELLVKCEFMNPAGSMKDRIAYRMIKDAEEKGILKPGDTIIEPTSGNTGIGLAMVAAVKGYKCVTVMPQWMSNEKQYTIQALGAEVVRTPVAGAWDNPEGPFVVSAKLHKETPNSVILNQYTNSSNALAYYDGTATEILEQTEGKIDYFVAGSGTGGTLTGIARKFRELSPRTKIIAVDPEGSTVADPPELNESSVTSWEIEGIGHVYVPTNMDKSVVDMWIKSNDRESFLVARSLIRDEGLLVGGSCGAVVSAALKLAKDLPADKRVVILLPDGIRNYMTKFVSDYWMESRGYLSPPEPIESNRLWWNLPLSSIQLNNSSTLPENSTCEEVMNIFQGKKLHQVSIINTKNEVVGVVTSNEILSNLISGKINKTEPVDKIICRQFRKENLETPLGKISRILEHENYAVVLDKSKKDIFVGIITQIDLLNFINNST